MRVKTRDYNNVTVAELQGDLDAESVELLQNTITNIIAANKAGIVLNMCEVSFIDSKGLEKMLWARDYCNQNNCQIRVAELSENTIKILEITRLENEFDRYIELAEAIKSFV